MKWRLRNLKEILSRKYITLPYEAFGGKLQIEIGVCDSSDPAQLICLWRKVRDVAQYQILDRIGGSMYLEEYSRPISGRFPAFDSRKIQSDAKALGASPPGA